MPRLHLPPEQLTGERVVLEGEPHKYLSRVLRLAAGDPADDLRRPGAGGRGAHRGHVGPDHRRWRWARAGRGSGRRRSPVTLIQAVPKGERMDLVIQKATELGVAAHRPDLDGAHGGAAGRRRPPAPLAHHRPGGRPPVRPRRRAGHRRAAAAGRGAGGGRPGGAASCCCGRNRRGAPLRRALAGDETAGARCWSAPRAASPPTRRRPPRPRAFRRWAWARDPGTAALGRALVQAALGRRWLGERGRRQAALGALEGAPTWLVPKMRPVR